MNYANFKEYDIANGPGIRFSLFVSGCTHHCKGCFNQETWDFNYGKPFTKETEDYILKEVGQEFYEGLTLLGGEPMEPANQKALLSLVTRFKEMYPQKNLWCFTGYLYDRDLLDNFAKKMPIFPKLKNKQSMVYVDNLCELIKLIIENNKGGIYYPQQECYIEISSYGGDTTGYQIPFNVHYTGVKTKGTFNASTKTFTAETA